MNAAARWLPVSGLLAAVALSLTGLISPAPPVAGSSAGVVVAYYGAHQTGLEVEGLIDAIGMMLLVVFAVTLHSRLRSPVSLAAAAAAGLVAACGLVQVATFETVAYRPGSDPSLSAILNDFQNFLFEVMTVPALVFLGGIAIAFLTSGRSPRWLGFAAAVAAVLQAVAWISFFAPTGVLAAGGLPNVISFLALVLWLAACSLTLLIRAARRPRRAIDEGQPGATY